MISQKMIVVCVNTKYYIIMANYYTTVLFIHTGIHIPCSSRIKLLCLSVSISSYKEHNIIIHARVTSVCACVRARVCMLVCVCVRARARMCVSVRVRVCAVCMHANFISFTN